MDKEQVINQCRTLLDAFQKGMLGDTTMPEEAHPEFSAEEAELRLAYFTLPMSLNYQRDSFSLWKSALLTYNDNLTKDVFDISYVVQVSPERLREQLMKYKVALQPNKHIATWQKISETVMTHWGSFSKLIIDSDRDFLALRELVQVKYKKGFPYLSGPKIFNYWSYIIQGYAGVTLKNSEYIEIAPDTHVTKASVVLGVIGQDEIATIAKVELSKRWRAILADSGILPIDMHSPLWFWSRSGFEFQPGNGLA